jgi:hypothetical protein
MTEPVRALDIRGIGFKTADAIAMRLGIDKTAMIKLLRRYRPAAASTPHRSPSSNELSAVPRSQPGARTNAASG